MESLFLELNQQRKHFCNYKVEKKSLQLNNCKKTVLHGVTQSAHVLNTKHGNIKCKEE